MLLTQYGPILAEAAIQAVKITAENLSGKTDAEKRDYAYQLIVQDLKTKGITVGVNVGNALVNAAIEMAVLKLKG